MIASGVIPLFTVCLQDVPSVAVSTVRVHYFLLVSMVSPICGETYASVDDIKKPSFDFVQTMAWKATCRSCQKSYSDEAPSEEGCFALALFNVSSFKVGL